MKKKFLFIILCFFPFLLMAAGLDPSDKQRIQEVLDRSIFNTSEEAPQNIL